jgi:hypothetical protein
MTTKDKTQLKRIYSRISSYCETLEQISNREQEKEVEADDDYDPTSDFLETATSHLFKCLWALEDIVNS